MLVKLILAGLGLIEDVIMENSDDYLSRKIIQSYIIGCKNSTNYPTIAVVPIDRIILIYERYLRWQPL